MDSRGEDGGCGQGAAVPCSAQHCRGHSLRCSSNVSSIGAIGFWVVEPTTYSVSPAIPELSHCGFRPIGFMITMDLIPAFQ